MAILRARGGRSFTRRPPMSNSPSVGLSKPAIMRRSVLLPQPDGPRSTRNSPSRVDRSTPFTAATVPKIFLMPRSSTVAISIRTSPAPDAFRKVPGKEKETPNCGSPFPARARRADAPVKLDQLALAPFIPDALALGFGFLDRILGAEHALGGLGEHHRDDPFLINLVDGGVGVSGVADV